MTRGLASVLAGTLLAAALAGCGSASSTETTSAEAVSSATVEATAAATGAGTDASAGADAASGGDIDQVNLQAELEAIERELDAMTFPDDADFGDIESALQ